MIRRMVFVARVSALLMGVAACGTSGTNDDKGQGASGSGASSPSGGSSSGGSNSGGSSGAGGAAGSTETGGAAGTSVGGSGGASSCPPGLPPSRSACSVPNLMCSYGQTICTCMVSLGEPGGMSWLCDGGGNGGSGGSGGSSGDPCGGCAADERCIHQAGGPGPSRYVCADAPSCTLAGECACIMGQGTCTYQMETTDAGVIGICVCDNGLE
jgi:hypothetical protein